MCICWCSQVLSESRTSSNVRMSLSIQCLHVHSPKTIATTTLATYSDVLVKLMDGQTAGTGMIACIAVLAYNNKEVGI